MRTGVQLDAALAAEPGRAAHDGAGARHGLAGRDAGGELELDGGADGTEGVVVAWRLGAEGGDEPLRPEALQLAAVPGEHPAEPLEQGLEVAAERLGILLARRHAREYRHDPPLGRQAVPERRSPATRELRVLPQHLALELLQLR